MNAAADTAWRMALIGAAALVAFVIVSLILRSRVKRFLPSLLVCAGVFWGLFAAHVAPAIYASAFGADPDRAWPVAVVIYALAAVAAVLFARKGYAAAVVAAGGGTIIQWVLALLLADIYGAFTR